jgi:hypothetical protein
MQSITSAMSHSAAVRTAFMRLSAASEEGRSDERWLPTSTIGTGLSCTMKLRIGGRVGHRVGAVADDDAVAPFSISSPMAIGERLVLLGSHVLAEDAEELLGRQVRDVGELGHRAVELARGEGGDDRAGPVVEPAGDGAAGAEERDVLLLRVEGEVLLGDLVDGLAVAELAREAMRSARMPTL